METRLPLLEGVTATNATKVPFELTLQDFQGASLPSLKGRGYGAGDSSIIYEWIDEGWQDSGQVIDNTIKSITIGSIGKYAIDITLAAAGPVSLELNSTHMR